MILISHRGNINGPIIEKENSHSYINNAIKLGYDVEIDIWFKNNFFYLGHDEPMYKINPEYLINKKLWCHAKNIEAMEALKNINAHYFWHQKDDVILTSNKYFWTYPGKKLFKNSICVLPESSRKQKFECAGICSDYIENYKFLKND
tara:strand:- start:382 stop:822 length:441 start_codon:yes stop_codon:yes gene_type:complete